MNNSTNLSSNIYDEKTQTKYAKGRLLGRGGFAKCFELRSPDGSIFAGKILIKSKLNKESVKKGVLNEINIHRSLNHENIVKFNNSFQDKIHVYIILELCTHNSMRELIRRRKTITLPETRYFVAQIANACAYLHNNNIIHRDLKLDNVFIDKNIVAKVGDFGLASKLKHSSDLKTSFCGTPDFISPEILKRRGYSFETDVWSLGCIIYNLLVGVSPFRTKTLEEVYSKIEKNQYNIPFNIDESAHEAIRLTLDNDVDNRPTMTTLLKLPFFLEFTPKSLPRSILATEPKFEQNTSDKVAPMFDTIITGMTAVNEDEQQNLKTLQEQLNGVLNSSTLPNSEEAENIMDENENPKLLPIFWISKWVDHTAKFGFGYQLIDGSTGVIFLDSSKMIISANNINMQFLDDIGCEKLHSLNNYPKILGKKVSLAKSFKDHMDENLETTGEDKMKTDERVFSRLPYLKTWFRNKSAIVFYLSNGTFQINLFDDHTKLVLCPIMGAVTYIDSSKMFKTYELNSLKDNGCTKALRERIQYASKMIDRLLLSS